MPDPVDRGDDRSRNIRYDAHSMDTKHIKDRAERKKLKRAARKKQPPKPKRTEPRGSHKKKIKKMARGQRKR